MTQRSFFVAILTAILVSLFSHPSAATSGSSGNDGWGGRTEADSVVVKNSEDASHEGAPTADSGAADRWQRHAVCREWYTEEVGGVRFAGSWEGEIPSCVTQMEPPDNCPDG